MPNPPLISVVMPAYNAAAFVREAVQSVAEQTWPRVELLAVDDGSSDATPEILADLEGAFNASGRTLRLIRQPNAGAAAARNTGLDAAAGEYVAFLDSDDRWRPTLLERLMETLQSNPSADLTFPLYRYIDETSAPIGFTSRSYADAYGHADVMMRNPIHSATGVLMRGSAVERTGRFDTNLRACIDLDFWVRMAVGRPGSIVPTPHLLADYRKHSDQITEDWRRMERHWTIVADKLEAQGHGLSRRQWARGRSRRCVFWSGIAYAGGEYSDARRLIAEAWRRDPLRVAADPHAVVRTVSCLASLLPRPVHDSARATFHAARRGLASRNAPG